MPAPARLGALAILILAAAALLAPGTAAHANHVEADAQVAADGTVRVEGVLRTEPGWLAIHDVNASGGLGPVLGVAATDPDAGYVTDVAVAVNRSRVNGSLDGRTAAVLHAQEGGPGFDPDEDPVVRTFGEPVASRFPVEEGPDPVYVGARTFGPQTVENGSASLSRVDADARTHVVLRRLPEGADGSSSGAILGSRLLGPGTGTNVSVPVERPEGVAANESVKVRAALLRDDGDGSLGPEDEPVAVGNETVASATTLEWPPEGDGSGPGAGYGEPGDGGAEDPTRDVPARGPGPTLAALLGAAGALRGPVKPGRRARSG